MELRRAEGGRLLAAILLASCQLCFVAGAPARATDNYVSVCPFVVNPNADLPWEDLTPLPKAPPSSRPPPSPPPRPPPPPPSTSSCPAINANCGGIVPDFIYEPSAEYSGFDSLGATSSSTSAATCGTLCLSKAGCVGFVHNVSSGICSFRTYLASGVAKSGIDTWRRCNLPPPPPVKPSTSTSSPTQAVCGAKLLGYTWKPYQNMQGFDSPLGKSGVASNITTCATVCNAMSECVAFTYDLTSKICYYKSGLGPLVALNRVDTYVKCQGPTTQSGARRRLLAAAALPRWSNPATWPNGVVPGIGAAVGANATIPCGKTVLLDVPDLTLDVLQIQGLLKFLDDPSLPSIYVRANFVLVEGQLFIGTPKQQFRHKATIELTPNTRNGRAHLLFSSTPPADAANPRSLGHKAFAVVGGQLRLHGLPGPGSMPVWGKLSATAKVNDWSIKLDKNVADSWPVGAQIAVASTDYDMNQAELFTIKKVVGSGSGSVITLDRPLRYMHYGDSRGLPDGFGGFVDQRAEVALLSRNIVITGTDEPAPYQYEGGHFMVFMTPTPQYIEGVEFFKLGQQGSLGRYSIHFHINGNTPQTVCRKNSIHQSKQRCIVVHACHNMTIESNVAFDTAGHCFLVEEGGETGNTFISNLGMLTKSVDRSIPLSPNSPGGTEETDSAASTYWISNPYNNFKNNVAAGAADSGFWIELRQAVRGNSLDIPLLSKVRPIEQRMGQYTGNVAHSNGAMGVRTYPHGLRPRNPDGSPATGEFSQFNSYKNRWSGFFIHNTEQLRITGATVSDNPWGVFLNQDVAVNLTSSRVVGLTNNRGNPSGCSRVDQWTSCRPLKGCSMPVNPAQARTVGNSRLAVSLGVVIDQGNRSDDGARPIKIQSTRFSNFEDGCTKAAAIALLGNGDFWNPSQSVQAVKFATNTNKIWAAPKSYTATPWLAAQDGGEQSQFYTLWDTDGSLTGSKGFVVVNNPKILPPGKKGCKLFPQWNAYACGGTCYRTLELSYFEPAFRSGAGAHNNKPRDYSRLEVTRASDGQLLSLLGNLNQVGQYAQRSSSQRFFAFTLLANQIYRVKIVPGAYDPSFAPANVTVEYKDAGCGQGLTLQLQPMSKKAWGVPGNTDTLAPKLCPGVAPLPLLTSSAQYSQACIGKVAWMEVRLGAVMTSPVTLVQSSASTACTTSSYSCSALVSGTGGWLYDATGLERPPLFPSPLAPTTGWSTGTAPFGFTTWGSPLLRTILPRPSPSRLTYYFRKSFTLRDTVCFSALEVEVMVGDGVVVYLNNKEILRANMPSGPVTHATRALAFQEFAVWKTAVIHLPGPKDAYNLVEGTNYIAVEQHVAQPWAFQPAFDMRITGRRGVRCSGPRKTSEYCDGVDNNNDGKVDVYSNGKAMRKSCTTACGTGVAICKAGLFQQCSSRAPTQEKCNGVDDDCDGLVDNGDDQMDCAAGRVCSRGKCLPVTNATVAQQVWPRNASGWAYYDKGGDLDATNSDWRTGKQGPGWKTGGKGPLGWNRLPQHQSWDKFGTVISAFGDDGKSMAGYFLKSFSLTATELTNTLSLAFSVRRVDGAVVYLNGVELWRTNMNSGPVQWNTRAAGNTQTSGTHNLQWTYNECDACFHNTSKPLKTGVNWIAAELHLGYPWEPQGAFDMDLFRNVLVPCSSLPGKPATCVRQVSQPIISPQGVWQYADASLPLPPSSWRLPSFSAASWKSGVAPLGNGPDWLVKTSISLGSSGGLRTTFYFRRVIEVPDSLCYFQLNANLLANDGAVVYFNGLEVYRFSIPPGNVTPDTYAIYGGDWAYHVKSLAGGWLKVGKNVVAVELHRAQDTTKNIFFDLQVVGSREAVTCTPKPL